MTKDDTVSFLLKWKELIIVLVGLGVFIGTAQAEIRSLRRSVDGLVSDHDVVQGLGRLACSYIPDESAQQGMPCDELLHRGNRLR